MAKIKMHLLLRASYQGARLFVRNTALQVLSVLFIAIFLGDKFSLNSKCFFYSLSETIREILFFFLPFIIFSCIFSSMLNNRGKAWSFLKLLFFSILVSNLLSTLAGFVGAGLGLKLITLPQSKLAASSFYKLWQFDLTAIVSNEQALLVGLGLGIFFATNPNEKIIKSSQVLNKLMMQFLEKFFIPLLPVFAFGYLLKLQHEQSSALIHYLPIIMLVLLVSASYVLSLLLLAANGKLDKLKNYLRNILPAGIVGFSTMSSLAAMPLTLKGAIANTNNPQLAKAVVPATVNIHTIGDNISIPILALTILMIFAAPLPTGSEIMIFILYWLAAKFSVAAVPSGAILVALPLLQNYLGFTEEMSALALSLFVLFDPIVTVTNIIGNSTFVIFFSKAFKTTELEPLVKSN